MSTAPQVTSKTTSDDPKQSTPIPLNLTDQTNLLPFRKLLPLFSGITLCAVVAVLDSVIIATALPHHFRCFQRRLGGVVGPGRLHARFYELPALCGRFSDIFGRKGALCVAMVVFMLASLASGFSTSITQLIIFRGFAGVGGEGIITLSQIILSDVVRLRDRSKYQGVVAGFASLGYLVGPPIGGALSEIVSWRVCVRPSRVHSSR
ncbi:major facilitator superfamily domain-containing protein [Melanogaster broomeanus]|nr:major facilitator superfamily domain-containing protein [Melanogaster broomeanus]